MDLRGVAMSAGDYQQKLRSIRSLLSKSNPEVANLDDGDLLAVARMTVKELDRSNANGSVESTALQPDYNK